MLTRAWFFLLACLPACQVRIRANFFPVQLTLDQDIIQYDMQILDRYISTVQFVGEFSVKT